jgi:hypothetical protein
MTWRKIIGVARSRALFSLQHLTNMPEPLAPAMPELLHLMILDVKCKQGGVHSEP